VSKANPEKMKNSGPFGDCLVVKLEEMSRRVKRPLYFALTLYDSAILDSLKKKGRNAGLAIRVSSTERPVADELDAVMSRWLKDFRTAGLDSWGIRYRNNSDAGRWLISNYAIAMVSCCAALEERSPELRAALFQWYLDHLDKIIPAQHQESIARLWCEQNDLEIVKKWCRANGISE
jgi:hypothetical protein